MISSPCKGCKKQSLPKDICMRTCKIIQDLQDAQMSEKELILSHHIDYVDESTFATNSRL